MKADAERRAAGAWGAEQGILVAADICMDPRLDLDWSSFNLVGLDPDGRAVVDWSL